MPTYTLKDEPKAGDLVLFKPPQRFPDVKKNTFFTLYKNPQSIVRSGTIHNNTLCLVIATNMTEGGPWIMVFVEQQLGWRWTSEFVRVRRWHGLERKNT